MRDRFHASLAVVKKWEGGLSDYKQDPGGITKWGISLRFLRGIGMDINGDGVVDGVDIRNLAEVQVAELYRWHFWEEVEGEQLPDGLDLCVFDCAVNQGVGRARRLLQKSVGVKADGIIGPKTMRAIQNAIPEVVINEFMARRARHYSRLRNVVVFGLGWFRRLFDVHHIAVAMRHDMRHGSAAASHDGRGR